VKSVDDHDKETEMMSDPESNRRAGLLARRIPRDEIVKDRAYVIHARNGGVGVATTSGYLLRRVKFDRVYLDEETDWQLNTTHGTAIPLLLIEELPPLAELRVRLDADAWPQSAANSSTEEALLAWLLEQERKHATLIKAAWDEVLGYQRRPK
jgi:hypothetical protein